MKKTILIVGIVCFVLSLCVVGVSVSMPIVMGPRASWGEAMMGIIPGAVCAVLSLIIAGVGLVLVMTAPKNEAGNRTPRRDADIEDNN